MSAPISIAELISAKQRLAGNWPDVGDRDTLDILLRAAVELPPEDFRAILAERPQFAAYLLAKAVQKVSVKDEPCASSGLPGYGCDIGVNMLAESAAISTGEPNLNAPKP